MGLRTLILTLPYSCTHLQRGADTGVRWAPVAPERNFPSKARAQGLLDMSLSFFSQTEP